MRRGPHLHFDSTTGAILNSVGNRRHFQEIFQGRKNVPTLRGRPHGTTPARGAEAVSERAHAGVLIKFDR